MRPKKTLLSWSGGKDSAWALHTLRQDPAYQVAALLTTVNEEFHRVAIHGFREELLDLQAASVGLPILKIPLPYPCSNEAYESRMRGCLRACGARGIRSGCVRRFISGRHSRLSRRTPCRDRTGAGISYLGNSDGSTGANHGRCGTAGSHHVPRSA